MKTDKEIEDAIEIIGRSFRSLLRLTPLAGTVLANGQQIPSVDVLVRSTQAAQSMLSALCWVAGKDIDAVLGNTTGTPHPSFEAMLTNSKEGQKRALERMPTTGGAA